MPLNAWLRWLTAQHLANIILAAGQAFLACAFILRLGHYQTGCLLEGDRCAAAGPRSMQRRRLCPSCQGRHQCTSLLVCTETQIYSTFWHISAFDNSTDQQPR